MQDKKTKTLVFSALFAALCCVTTLVPHIPTPLSGGYIHAGDALVILSAFALGPLWGALAAGLGSGLADVITGYMLYAPGTFAIKALMALIAGLILRGGVFKKPAVNAFLASFAAELFMVAGYFVYEYWILGYGYGVIANVPMNAIQGAFGMVAGSALYLALPLEKLNLK